MKVRCVNLKNWANQPQESSGWLKVGDVYQVLMILIEPTRTMLRLVGGTPTPALFQLDMFEVASNIVPTTWVVSQLKPGFLTLGPEQWVRPGFWEAYFDGRPEAVACFDEERRKIIESDP